MILMRWLKIQFKLFLSFYMSFGTFPHCVLICSSNNYCTSIICSFVHESDSRLSDVSQKSPARLFLIVLEYFSVTQYNQGCLDKTNQSD